MKFIVFISILLFSSPLFSHSKSLDLLADLPITFTETTLFPSGNVQNSFSFAKVIVGREVGFVSNEKNSLDALSDFTLLYIVYAGFRDHNAKSELGSFILKHYKKTDFILDQYPFWKPTMSYPQKVSAVMSYLKDTYNIRGILTNFDEGYEIVGDYHYVMDEITPESLSNVTKDIEAELKKSEGAL